MTKTQKILGTSAIAAAVAYFVFRGHQRRWQVFTDFGNAAFVDGKGHDLAIRVNDAKHGIKPGDNVTVEHSKLDGGQPTTFQVDRLAVKPSNGTHWIIFKTEHFTTTGDQPVPGRFKLGNK